MAINPADILTLVKARISVEDDSLNDLIESYVEQIEQRILHYCNIVQVPDGLKFTWVNMVIAALKSEQSHLPEVEAIMELPEVKIGDTMIKTTKGASADAIVSSFSVDLNRYRKLRW